MTNPVVEYLKDHPNIIYSLRTLSKRLHLRKKIINQYYYQDQKFNSNPEIKNAEPLDIGSNRHNLNLVYY